MTEEENDMQALEIESCVIPFVNAWSYFVISPVCVLYYKMHAHTHTLFHSAQIFRHTVQKL